MKKRITVTLFTLCLLLNANAVYAALATLQEQKVADFNLSQTTKKVAVQETEVIQEVMVVDQLSPTERITTEVQEQVITKEDLVVVDQTAPTIAETIYQSEESIEVQDQVITKEDLVVTDINSNLFNTEQVIEQEKSVDLIAVDQINPNISDQLTLQGSDSNVIVEEENDFNLEIFTPTDEITEKPKVSLTENREIGDLQLAEPLAPNVGKFIPKVSDPQTIQPLPDDLEVTPVPPEGIAEIPSQTEESDSTTDCLDLIATPVTCQLFNDGALCEDEETGRDVLDLKGNITDVKILDGKMFVATEDAGVFSYNTATQTKESLYTFDQVGSVSNLIVKEDTLYALNSQDQIYSTSLKKQVLAKSIRFATLTSSKIELDPKQYQISPETLEGIICVGGNTIDDVDDDILLDIDIENVTPLAKIDFTEEVLDDTTEYVAVASDTQSDTQDESVEEEEAVEEEDANEDDLSEDTFASVDLSSSEVDASETSTQISGGYMMSGGSCTLQTSGVAQTTMSLDLMVVILAVGILVLLRRRKV